MLDFSCELCSENIEVPGGLLFSPPDENGLCFKKHICKYCYLSILND